MRDHLYPPVSVAGGEGSAVAGPQWAFVDASAPGAPLQLDPTFYYERQTGKVWHRAVDAPA